ncbi:MAG: ParB/RepB/Spo0J family partition protein, partial [Deltaproteobacteria bacterium]|nr:ParB/RepB/Spo0J family partition protein [Deltaproteobacteria bacterium]
MTQLQNDIPADSHSYAAPIQPHAPAELASAAFAAGANLEQLGVQKRGNFHFIELNSSAGKLRSAAAESIDALFKDGRVDMEHCGEIQLLRRELIVPAPYNPRHYVNREAMLTLLQSVSAQGLHTPLEVSQHPEDGKVYLLSGHRRLWVANALGLDLLPCRVDPRGILTEVQMREALIKYNEGQERPAPIDRAQSIFEYIRVSGKTQLEVAGLFNMSPAGLTQMLKLLTLPTVIQTQINLGQLPIAVGLQIARHPGGERAQIELAERVAKEGLSAPQVHTIIGRLRSASALHRPPQHVRNPSTSQDRRKEYGITVAGAHPVQITVSSNKAALSPEQIESALQEVINEFPIEFAVHHRSGATAPTSQPPLTEISSLRQSPATAGGEIEGQPAAGALAEVSNANPTSPGLVHGAARIATPRGELTSAAAHSIHAVFIDGKPDWSQPSVVQLIYRELLTPHPLNPRKFVSRSAMEDTLNSIRKTGMHTPVHISEFPGDPERAYLIGGHRRHYCATKLGFELVPCRLDPRGVLSELQIREGLVRDNEGQEKPAPIDRARSYSDFITASRLTPADAADRLGINFSTMTRAMRPLALLPSVQEV